MPIYTPNILSIISTTIRSKVLQRTQRQYTDYLGRRFVSYSQAYASRKARLLGKSKVDLNKVDLKLTGQMLKDFYVTAKSVPKKHNVLGESVSLDTVQVTYGFKTKESLDKYFWNAANTRHNKHRDFLGLAGDGILMPERELKQVVLDAVAKT